jgi:acyl dehydratase
MKFNEFYAGQQISAGPYEVKLDEVLEFARAYDPQWFHVDAGAASNGPFKGLIASGGRYALCTMCIGVGQGVAIILERV